MTARGKARDSSVLRAEFVGKKVRAMAAGATHISLARVKKPREADIVVMAREDYETLAATAEDRETQDAYERTRGEESVPAELVDRLLGGENPIRVWRQYRGLSLTDLARSAEISKSYLSEIENGRRIGTIDTLKALAAVLSVDVDDLT